MNIKHLIEELSKYPQDMEVVLSDAISRTIVEGEIIIDPYPDYNLVVITYTDEEE